MENKTIVTEAYLIENGFIKKGSLGWDKFVKDNIFELVGIPMKSGKIIIGIEHIVNSQTKYKYPLTINELNSLYSILTNKSL